MTEILFIIVLWGSALAVSSRGRLPGPLANVSSGLGREHTAVVLLMAAIHARLQTVGSSPIVLETALRGALVLAALAVVFPTARRSIRLSDTVRRRRYAIAAFAAYVAVAALSIVYAAAPLQTVGKVLELGTLFVIVWHLTSRPDAADALKRTMALVVYLEFVLIAVAVIGFFLLPSTFAETLSRRGFFFRDTLTPPYTSSNSISARGAMVATAAAVLFFKSLGRQRMMWAAVAAISTFAIVLSAGRQGIAILLVGLAIVLLLVNRQAFFLVAMPLGAVVLLLASDSIIDILSRDQVQGSLNTLTGRTTFWAAGWDAFVARPWTGWGFGGSRYSALATIGAEEFTHLHNGYLEALVGVGILGFLPLMVTLGFVVHWAWGRLTTRQDPEYAILLVGLVLQNLIGRGFGSWLNFNLIVFALMVGLADTDRPHARRAAGRRPQRLVTSR